MNVQGFLFRSTLAVALALSAAAAQPLPESAGQTGDAFPLPAESATTVSADNGRALFEAAGCSTCHSRSGATEGKSGPPLGGLAGLTRTFVGGEQALATDEYIRESILDPGARIVAEFDLEEGSMPTYREALTDAQIRSLVLFVRSLEPGPAGETAGAPTVQPGYDPPDQPFRRAPMPESSRSIAIRLSPDMHLAFDSALLRTHTVWAGKGLSLFGPPYSGSKSPFICRIDGEVLWRNPPFFPWSFDSIPGLDPTRLPPGADLKGVSVKGGGVTLIYEIGAASGERIRIHERPSHLRIAGVRAGVDAEVVLRRFELEPCDRDLWFLAHTAAGSGTSIAAGSGGVILARDGAGSESGFLAMAASGAAGDGWRVVEVDAAYREQIITDENTESGKEFRVVTGRETRVYLKIPAHASAISIEIGSAVVPDAAAAAAVLDRIVARTVEPPDMAGLTDGSVDSGHPERLELRGAGNGNAAAGGDAHYRIEPFPLPSEADLLVGGMDWLPNGDLAVCTWAKGEVWIVRNPRGPVREAAYTRFARGLMEPLGLQVVDGSIYVVQKGELTRLTDTDGDGVADLQESILDDWGFSGNYHSYAFGPVADPEGVLHVFVCGRRGRWDLRYSGWALQFDPVTGAHSGFARGFRAPNGPGLYGPAGDIFVTDNQGDWIGACKLNHVKPGAAYGYPAGDPAPRELYGDSGDFQPPAVWIPYHLSQSASGIATISSDRFGPFQGQMLVGEFQLGTVQRVFLERVNGEWQGAVWPFAKGFDGTVNRLLMGADGRLYVGGGRRTWPAAKPRENSLERVEFTGVTPFEMKEIRARPDGFRLILTQPADRVTAANIAGYEVSQYRYKHHATYGSPEFDHQGVPGRATVLRVAGADVSPDRSSVELRVPDLKPGYVTRIRARGIRNALGQPLRHDTGHYTLNSLPE